jgi:hypothetical protein
MEPSLRRSRRTVQAPTRLEDDSPPCTPKKTNDILPKKRHQITPSSPPKSNLSDDISEENLLKNTEDQKSEDHLSGIDDDDVPSDNSERNTKSHPSENFTQMEWWRRYNRLDTNFKKMCHKMEEVKSSLNNETRFVKELKKDYEKL